MVDDVTPAALPDDYPKVYQAPQHYDVMAQMTAPKDLPFYQRFVGSRSGSLLEIGCGTGRLTLEFAKLGLEVFGLDRSAALIEFARQKAESESLALTLAIGDMRGFDFGRTFDSIIVPFNTINHLLSPEDFSGFVASLIKHMDRETRVVIDTFQPSVAFLANAPEERRQILRYRDPYTGHEVKLHEENHYHGATQINRIDWTYEIEGESEPQKDALKMRLFFPAELRTIFHLAGFELESAFGSYDETPFDEFSSNHLLIYRLQ